MMSKMRLIRGLHNLPNNWSACAMTIGNFDGLHIGHQQLLAACVASAKCLNVPAVLVTFEPYPKAFFSKDEKVPRLMGLRDKVLALQNSGIDYLCILPFNAALAGLSAERFVVDVLVDRLKMVFLVVGDDFRFGAGRAGDFPLLEKLSASHHFEATQLKTFLHEGERVSSSRLRAALGEGNLVLARQLQGHDYQLSGCVVSGDQRGRAFGYPTANIYVSQPYFPIAGIFVVRIDGLADVSLRGVASVGKRPMYPSKRDVLEVFLLDFNQKIYGEHLTVTFLHKLRDEMCFESEAALIAQIEKDVAETESYFS